MAVGVSTSIAVKGTGGGSQDGTSQLFVLGQSPWGPTDVPTQVSSYSDWFQKFGGVTDLLTLAADGYADTWTTSTAANLVQITYNMDKYFKNKGNNPSKVFFVRVPTRAISFTLASRTFTDGSSHNTTIAAKHDGYAPSAIQVTISNSRRGVSNEKTFKIELPQSGKPAEYWDIATAADATAASQNSYWVNITLPAGGQLPSNTTGAQKLGNGTLGTADTYTAVPGDFVGTTATNGTRTGLQSFNKIDKGWADVIVPGQYDPVVQAAIATQAENYWRFGHLGCKDGYTVDTIQNQFPNSRFKSIAAYTPELRVGNFNSQQNGTLLIDPVGAVVGQFHRADGQLRGPHGSAAGLDNPLLDTVDTERFSNGQELYTDDDINTLDDAFINGIRDKNGVIHLANFVTRSTDLRLNQIPVVRTLYYIAHKMQPVLNRYIGKPLTYSQLADIKADCTFEMLKLLEVGSLTGTKPSREPQATDAFLVQCDSSNNSPDQMSAGQVSLTIVAAITRSIKKINFTIVSSNIGSVLSVS